MKRKHFIEELRIKLKTYPQNRPHGGIGPSYEEERYSAGILSGFEQGAEWAYGIMIDFYEKQNNYAMVRGYEMADERKKSIKKFDRLLIIEGENPIEDISENKKVIENYNVVIYVNTKSKDTSILKNRYGKEGDVMEYLYEIFPKYP